jgi:hypothetical protein
MPTAEWPSDAAEAAAMDSAQALAIVLETEASLRVLIRKVLTRKREDWQQLVPQALRQRLAAGESESRVGNPYGPARSRDDILDSASIGDMQAIIAGRWQFFEEIFGVKAATLSRLDEFRLFRNAVAHGAELAADDKARLYLLAKDLLGRIPRVFQDASEMSTVSVPGTEAPTTELRDSQRPRRLVASENFRPGIDREGSPSALRVFRSRIRARWLERLLVDLQTRRSVTIAEIGHWRGLPVISVRVRGVARIRCVVGQTSLGLLGESARTGGVIWFRNATEAQEMLTEQLGSLE